MSFTYQYPSTTKDGRFVPVTYPDLIPPQDSLSDKQKLIVAKAFDIPINHLNAVLKVESAGNGFLLKEKPPARPKILFERHVFYKVGGKGLSKERPDLSWSSWDKSFYKGGSAEWDRLKDAMAFNQVAALKATSWGLGQVLGMNFSQAGCATIEQFVEENFTSEFYQLQHMLNFIKNSGLLGHLQAGRWASFAKGYNGPMYKQNQYDSKLEVAARG